MLLLVRHGRSVWNAERRLTGRTDVPLDEVGLAQARALDGRFEPLGEVRTTSLSRARATASLLAPDLDAVVDDAFIELDYGDAEGMRVDEVPTGTWRELRADPARRWPGGESLDDVQQRVAAAMEELFAHEGHGARRADGDVLVVSHVAPIKAAVCWVLGCAATATLRMRLDNATVTRVGFGPLGVVLLAYNERLAGVPA